MFSRSMPLNMTYLASLLGPPAKHTHILNDTSGVPFVFMRRQPHHVYCVLADSFFLMGSEGHGGR